MEPQRVLISGGGIAGLTLAIALKKNGFEPVVIERDSKPRRDGYMMDFFGTGWDVAQRLDLTDQIRAVKYPIDDLALLGHDGAAYLKVPVERIREALERRYTYLRRSDLEQILLDAAAAHGIAIRYDTSLHALAELSGEVRATFVGGNVEHFALVIGADGAHSRVRTIAFGPERQFASFLGYYVAAFHVPQNGYDIGRVCKIYEETDRSAFYYPLDDKRMDATYVFRHQERDFAAGQSMSFVRSHYRGGGWITEDVLNNYPGSEPHYFDSATQIVMPQWHRGRIALIGDACGCLTLIAGQGSHMAMAGGYVLAEELARRPGHEAAFHAYQAFLKPHVDRKQREAARFARFFVPLKTSRPWLRRLTMKLIFSRFGLPLMMRFMGGRSVLPRRAA